MIQVAHYFKILNSYMEQIMNREVQKLDLTAAQSQIIGFLTFRPDPPCARDLEEYFHLSHATVSGLLSRMEAKDFIEVRPDPVDRRVKRIYLREKGHACSQRTKEVIDEINQLLLDGFLPEEQEQFERYLRRAAENLGGKSLHPYHKREE